MATTTNITLNNNAIYTVLQNMVISQHVFSDPIGGLSSEIVDANRVDGTLYGDQKQYMSVDMIHPRDWNGDDEATNLLALERNTKVSQEQITLDTFKMFKLTTGTMKEKQAFMNEGNFSNFNAVQLAMIRDGKRAYDVTTYNAFIGTHARDEKTITVPQGANEALVLSKGIADIVDDMGELETSYNGWGYLRAYGRDDLQIIFNKKYLNSWKLVDLPEVYHPDGILHSHQAMNSKYFGVPVTAPVAKTDRTATDGIRFAKCVTVTEQAATSTVPAVTKTYYAGTFVPTDYAIGATAGVKIVAKEDVYKEDASIVGIIIGKGAAPFMSAAEASSAFWNPQSLTNTNFLIYGHNTLKALQEKPYIVIKKA